MLCLGDLCRNGIFCVSLQTIMIGMKRLFVYVVLALLWIVPCRGEQFTWSGHDLTFDVPEGGLVTYNSRSVFEIQWYDLTLVVKLYDKSEADDDYMKFALNKTAAGYNMFDTKMEKAKVDGCKGYSLTGTLPDGSRACLTNVKAKKRDLAMQIEINYIAGNEKTVKDILDSFKIGKKQKPKQKIQKKGAKEKPIKPGTLEGEELHYI